LYLCLSREAEGNFDVRSPKVSYGIGRRIQLRFRITQHDRDTKLMELITEYFTSGKLYKYPDKPAVAVTIVKLSDITNIIIPFFEQYPLIGIKQLDYLDRCKIAKLMNEGAHLTEEGINLICTIKAGINTGRKI